MAEVYRERLSLSPQFFVLHWRSEATDCDMEACAQTLRQGAQQVLSEHYNGAAHDASGRHRCLLISDIPFNKAKPLWGTSYWQKHGGYAKALAILGVGTAGTPNAPAWGGCRKLDELDLSGADLGVVSMIERALAQQAQYVTMHHPLRRALAVAHPMGRCCAPWPQEGPRVSQGACCLTRRLCCCARSRPRYLWTCKGGRKTCGGCARGTYV